MNSQEERDLADAIVACGLATKKDITAGGHGNERIETVYCLSSDLRCTCGYRAFIRDWRVAGAMLQKSAENASAAQLDGTGYFMRTLIDPIAINKSCVAALQGESDSD